MSLYIGNLSVRIRKDELERAFRRFGRCTVQLKDGYGFVVYDFPPDAEKALRALQGRNICGGALTLTWSNKQPRLFKRFAKADRSYERLHGRNSSRVGDYVNRKLGSNGWQDYKTAVKLPDSNVERLNHAGILDEETGQHQDNIKDYIGEEHHEYREDLPDEGGCIQSNHGDNDRWGGKLNYPINENALKFDRYEPYQGYDRKDEDENHQMAYSGGSPARGSSQEKTVRAHTGKVSLMRTYDSKSQQTCYTCGGLGHKMRNCPMEKASQRKLARLDHKANNDLSRRGRVEGDLERHVSRSQGKRASTKDPISMRRLRRDRKASDSGKHQSLIGVGSSLEAKETDRVRRKGYDYEGKKRSSRENGCPKRKSIKKARRPVSFPLRSDYTASRSWSTSKSSEHVPRSISRSRSKSLSSRSHSLSSDSRSTLRHSRSKSSKSRSRSSSPTSLSLSASLDGPLPSSPNKVQLNQQGSLNNSSTPETEEIMVEMGQLDKGVEQLENAKLESGVVAVNHENAVSSCKEENEKEKEQRLHRNNNGNYKVSKMLHEVTNQSNQQSEKGAHTAASLSLETVRAAKVAQDLDASLIENMPVPTRNPDSEAPPSSCSGHPTSISSEEMYMVLKHYGLELPNENERHLSVETYFGSARLWPWDIIYYRRLKKGPISVENYSRRLVQNKEFGIVDKYIRSSSGWGDMEHANP